jgi:hypothetical protein
MLVAPVEAEVFIDLISRLQEHELVITLTLQFKASSNSFVPLIILLGYGFL